MKKLHLLFILCAVAVMGLFTACHTDKLPDNFPEGCPNFTDHAYAGDLFEAMAPGIYVFKLSETYGKTAVLAKSNDGGVFWLENTEYIDPDHSNFIGNTLYLGFYAVDGANSCYSLYGETIEGHGKAQYYDQREFADRKAMCKGITTPAGLTDERFNYALNVADGILDYPMCMSHIAYHYDTFLDSWGATYDTTICDIPVTCYAHEGHRYFVDKNWMCLYHLNYNMLNSVTNHTVHELLHYYEAGTFEETYAKIYELYGNSMPKPLWNTCIRNYRKQANEWLYDEYPESLHGWFKVFHGAGTIHDMSVARRATWPGYDRICTITVRIEGVSFEDGMEYKNEAAGVCDEIREDLWNDNLGTLSFKGSLENIDIAGIDFGDSYVHPAYEITLNQEGTLVIVFDLIKTTVV